MDRRTAIIGTTLVVVSSISFAALPLFAHMAYDDGVTPVSLLFLRFTVAGALMMGITHLRGEKLPRGRQLLAFALLGGIGYVGQSYSVFKALTLADAGLVMLLLYLYPAIVTLLTGVFGSEPLSGRKILAIAVALIGTGFTVSPRLEGQLLGIALGLAAALIYSLYVITGNRLLREAPPIASSAVIMCSAAVVFGVLAAANGVTLPHSLRGWSGVVGVSVVAGVIAVTTFLTGLKLIGPTRASLFSTVQPVAAVVLAALFLGERIGPWTAAGGVLIVTAIVVLSYGGSVDTQPDAC